MCTKRGSQVVGQGWSIRGSGWWSPNRLRLGIRYGGAQGCLGKIHLLSWGGGNMAEQIEEPPAGARISRARRARNSSIRK